MSRCSVRVRGVPKELSKTDLEIYFQSRKKSNGGDIDKIEVDRDRGEARIVFKESSAAERVLAKGIYEYEGACLTVAKEMQSRKDRTSERPGDEEELEESECASVLVSGLSSKTTKDAIQMYFENSRRSHGGDVKNVKLKDNEAVVTFESPNVAKKVLEWGKHTLDGCPLTVTRPVQPKKTPSLNEEEDPEQPVQRSRVVRVIGISDKTTKDALLNFFENTRRSGGGEIEDIQHMPEERLADITFCSPDDAERVSQKGILELDDSKLTMTLKEIPKEIPKDPNKLHVMGIGEKTTKDGLISFMEVVSGEEVDNMFFGSNSNALVTFKEPPDIDKVQKKCSTRAIDGSHLKIEQVNICDCIEVTGLAPNTTKDTVFYYFDNPRNGGGEVEKVEMDSDNTRALVFFEDPSVVNTVVKTKHKINEAKLKVVPYYPFLGESLIQPAGGKKERVVKVDPMTMAFIDKFIQQEFDRLLQESRVKYTWQQGSDEIFLACAEPKMDKKTWENSCEAVVAFINQIVTEKITVSQEAWNEICEKAKEKCATFKTRLDVRYKERERSITLTGKKSDVSVLAEGLNDLNSEIQKQIEFEKNKISKSLSLTQAQIDLLSFSGFVEDLQTRCKDLEITFSKKNGSIDFRGPDAVVKEGNITVWQTLSRVKEVDMELPKSIVGIIVSQAGKVFMAAKFKKEYIDAVVNCDPNSDNQLVVTAVDRKDAKKAVVLIKDLTSEQSIPLDDHQKQLLNSEKWKQLKHSIQQSMLLQAKEELAASTLWIAGIKEEVDKAKEKIDGFFEENIILENVINADNGRLKFIFKYKKDAIQNMEKSFTNQSVKIIKKTDEEDGMSALVVCGTRDGIQKAVPNVQKLINEIKDRKVHLDEPGMKRLFSKRKGITQLSVVENEHDCIIERCTPTTDTKQNFSKTFHGNKSLSKLICSFVTPEGKTILLYKGDLTEHKVDVMVNAANESLKHIGGLAKSILVKGGQEIQDECDEYVLRNGNLLYGEVFVSKPGNLPCKRLVHAVGPRWDSNMGYYNTRIHDKGKKALILGQTVYNSLEKAEMFSSIAIPAISAGISGCPIEVCAKTLIESALEYSEEKSYSRLSEIHFVDMNDSVIKAFHDEMKSRFGKDHSFKDGATPKAEAKYGEGAKGRGRGLLTGAPSRGTIHYVQIYAADDKNLKRAETDILRLITENSKTKEIDHRAIGKMSDSQRSRVMRMEITHHTKIRIDQRINRIIIQGVAADVSNATVAVYDILNERSEEEHSRRYAELLSNNVQWYYEDGDKWEPYDDKTNAKMEHAFNDKKSNVLVSLQEGEDDELTSYKIDFNAMIEKNIDTGDTARVERRDKTAGVPLPPHWDPQPTDSDGKELDLHMVVLDPVKHKKEYDDVKGAIEKTTSVNISKIERVQNPGLYSTYAVKKQKMDDQNRSNEKKLFHGTAAATCQQINHKGFNRSFCGKNATTFGKGIYFARYASYSARPTYSPPDPAGNRYMYMASVLVGEYTVGQNYFITPPPKNPNNPTITYDTVVDNTSDPSIFVVFHDTQMYPDYLITFR